MTQQVFDRAKLLAGVEEGQQAELLQVFCQAAVTALTARLRSGVTAEDCREDLIAAASLLALAAYSDTDPLVNLQQMQLGDVTIRPGGGGAAAKCLRDQAEMIMLPHCESGFSFRGV